MSPPLVALRRVFSIVNGGTPTAEADNWDGHVPWATPVDLASVNGGRLSATMRSLTAKGLRTGSALVPAGSLVVSTRAPIGYVAELDVATAFNQGCRGLVPRARVDIRFFRYQLIACAGRLQSLGQGSTFVELSSEALASMPLVVPPLDRQGAIADFLDAETARVDALIGAKERLRLLVDERMRATTERQLWFDARTGKRRSAVPLRRFADRIDVGIAEAATHAYAEHGVPLLRSTNIRRNRLELDDLLFIEHWFAERNSTKYVRVGDLLTVRTGNVGVTAVVPIELDGCQCFTQLITTPRAPHVSEFLSSALNSQSAQEYFAMAGWGSAQANISVPLLASAPVPDVPAEEQQACLDRVRRVQVPANKTLASLDAQVGLLMERRQALITAAVTGELEIPNRAGKAS